MAELLTTDTDLGKVANAIRTKTGESGGLAYPDGFVSKINGIGSYGSDAAGASHILSGKKAYVGNSTVTGNIPSKGATTYNLSASNQTISAGQYLSGAQTIRGVATQNLTAANIKKGVTVYVGDTGSVSRIASITGTCAEAYTSLSQSAECYVPFMYKSGDACTVRFYWYSGNSFRVATTDASSNGQPFIVPRNIKMTYYPTDTSASTKTVTFVTGQVYTIGAYSQNVAHYWGGGLSYDTIFRVTKFENA